METIRVGIESTVTLPLAASTVIGYAAAVVGVDPPADTDDVELDAHATANAASNETARSDPLRERNRCIWTPSRPNARSSDQSPTAGFLTPGSTLPRPSQDRRRAGPRKAARRTDPSGVCRVRSPVTVARPCRTCTGFPAGPHRRTRPNDVLPSGLHGATAS